MRRLGRALARAGIAVIATILAAVLTLEFAGDRIYPCLLGVAARDGAGLAVRAGGTVQVQW